MTNDNDNVQLQPVCPTVQLLLFQAEYENHQDDSDIIDEQWFIVETFFSSSDFWSLMMLLSTGTFDHIECEWKMIDDTWTSMLRLEGGSGAVVIEAGENIYQWKNWFFFILKYQVPKY